jgi:hypothetical protein
MAALVEGQHAGEFILSEAPGNRSRENVTVLSGQDLEAGEVVGKVLYGIGSASIPVVVGTGNGTMTLVTAGPEVQEGNYVVKCITKVANGGVFSVTAPDGTALPNCTLTVGAGGTTAYTSRHINFSITDNTDFEVDDVFTIVVGSTAPTVIGGTGTGTLSAHALGPDAMPGNYRIITRAVVANGGDFEVIAPDGTSIGRFLMGTGSGAAATFTTRHVVFTLTDATDFILGNYFDLCVYNKVTKKVVEWDPTPTAWDGRQKACGVLYEAVDASLADKAGVLIAKDAEVRIGDLQWATGITAAEKLSAYADLEKLGVLARS